MKRSFLVARILYPTAVIGVACMLLGLFLLSIRPASAEGTSYVRVIHASPFVGTADVFVDGKKLLSSFQFASVTDYVAVPAGTHKVQVSLMGKGIDDSVITQDLSIKTGLTYTVAALGTEEGELSLQVFVDNNQVAPNNARLRVYQLSPDADTANIQLQDDINLNNVKYPSASEYLNVVAGSHTFNVTNPLTKTTIPLTVSLKANTVTSVFAVGLFKGDPKAQLVVKQVAGIPALPSTGSYPTIIDKVVEYPLTSWLLVAVLLALIGIAPLVRRMKRIA